MITLQLFLSFLQIGLFSFGGGYAAMPLLQEQLVARNGWLSVQEFADLVTIAEMTPGPIAVNAATFVGTKLAGLPGALLLVNCSRMEHSAASRIRKRTKFDPTRKMAACGIF